MDNMEKLTSLLSSPYSSLSGKEIVEHFRTRKDPVYLFGREDAERMEDKEVISDAEKVMDHDIFGWKFDGEIDYLFNPTTETSRDNEWSWSLFRTIYWQPLARAYALTKDEKYFNEFVHEMRQFIAAWPAKRYIEDTTFEIKQPYPGTAWRTIESGIRIYTTWLPCFEIFRQSTSWTEDDMAAFLLSVRDHALFLMGHYSNHDRSSNWLSMEASALLQIGIMFPEFKEAEEWKRTGYQRVMHEILYCFSDNGIHMEKTPIYHLVATIAFLQAVVLAEKNGMETAPYAIPLLTRAAEYVYSLIKPDLSTPMIGDADRDDLVTRKADTSVYEGMNLSFFPSDMNELRAFFRWMYDITGKEEFLYFATLREKGKAPEKTAYSYNAEGIYCVRTGWDEDADYALMHGVILERGEKSTHSHNDQGHVEITLRGEDILTDSGRYIYRSSVWKDWRAYFCSALAHNTLYCDGHEMGEVPGVTRVRGVRTMCNSFSCDGDAKIIDISHNGYVFIPDSVYHRRRTVLLPGHTAVILDWVTGKGEEDHDFALSFNFNKGKAEVDGGKVSYTTEKGTHFTLSFLSSAPFSPEYYYGSEEPKGGWISYGYPVREPSPQVRYTMRGRAPFTAVTAVAPEEAGVAVALDGTDAVVTISGERWIITKEKVEKL